MNNIEVPYEVRTAWCHAALVLSKKVSIGSAQANDELRKLLKEYGSIENIYQYFFSMVPVDPDIEKELNKAFSKVDFKFDVVTCVDDKYPSSINKVKGAPPVLYCQGDASIFSLEKSIAFVGTRELSEKSNI